MTHLHKYFCGATGGGMSEVGRGRADWIAKVTCRDRQPRRYINALDDQVGVVANHSDGVALPAVRRRDANSDIVIDTLMTATVLPICHYADRSADDKAEVSGNYGPSYRAFCLSLPSIAHGLGPCYKVAHRTHEADIISRGPQLQHLLSITGQHVRKSNVEGVAGGL